MTNNNIESITGKIIKVTDKGWGFIVSRDLKFTRIFFHWSGLHPSTKFSDLKIGMKVKFIPVDYHGQGYRAIKIEILPETKSVESRG